jgi:membrane protein YqaA with SNARE-associated domain
MSDHSTARPAELPIWVNIGIYILLLAVLAVFGDLFVFIVGFLTVTISFVAYFNARSSEHHDEHH